MENHYKINKMKTLIKYTANIFLLPYLLFIALPLLAIKIFIAYLEKRYADKQTKNN